MPVYVDNSRNPFRGHLMCHMLADTPDELHRMAEAIGMKRQWFQGFYKASCPHYDLTQSHRAQAVALGAIECDLPGIVAVIRRIKANREPWLKAAGPPIP